MSQPLDSVFAALADPTRRQVVETLLRDGTTSVPALASTLPITRQAIAKHLAALNSAGLVERTPGAGRSVSYRLAPDGLVPATDWIRATEQAWDGRLRRLKESVESTPEPSTGAEV